MSVAIPAWLFYGGIGVVVGMLLMFAFVRWLFSDIGPGWGPFR